MATRRTRTSYGPEDPAAPPDAEPRTDFVPPEYPYRLYHVSSRPGALVSAVVGDGDELAALGDGWGSAEELPFDTAPAGPPPPLLLTLEPATVAIGAPSFDVHVIGAGFVEEDVIVWNGFDEPTTLNSPNDVSTGVNMDVWHAPAVVPVAVRHSHGALSNALSFTFTEAPPLRRVAEPPARLERSEPPAKDDKNGKRERHDKRDRHEKDDKDTKADTDDKRDDDARRGL